MYAIYNTPRGSVKQYDKLAENGKRSENLNGKKKNR